MIELAKKHKLKIALGSDTFLSKEMYELQAMEWVARAKLFDDADVMIQATSAGAELVEMSGPRNRYREAKLGVIEAGAYADLVIIEGNPLEDVTILSKPDESLKLIMKDGIIYKDAL